MRIAKIQELQERKVADNTGTGMSSLGVGCI
jgi:hypothetical protein